MAKNRYLKLRPTPPPGATSVVKREHAQAVRALGAETIRRVARIERDPKGGDVVYFATAAAPWSLSLFEEA